MISRSAVDGSDQVRVTFVIPDGHLYGHVVAVVGDFNDWNPDANPMREQDDGRTATVIVQAGRRYGFRYLCDDCRWFNDDEADGYEPNGLGAENAVLDLTGGV